ncbi:unnamed protein product [Miscanthus lutarioriparius]|uniref:DUF4218 domain-containing protein n=1 Tax=Miscanthus lutarioriparius TaxID=422564 RepID=A0A811RDE2_9POAL|nr:unnamed protein product [Miscanthus lutarioriparius]
MATTYTRWIHHGEPLEVVPHEIDDHVDEHTSLNEDFGMNVDEEDDPDDGIHGMVEELYTAKEEEAILRGPVQYGWMYPVERRLLALKWFVRNMARPEGSIAEAYVAAKCLTICSRIYKKELENEGCPNVQKTLEKQFSSWFKKHPVSEDGVRVDASVVDDLRRQREAEGQQDASADSEDETGWQYVSDNEGPTIPLEDDNDSEYD